MASAAIPNNRPVRKDFTGQPAGQTLAIWSRRDGIVAPASARGTEATCDKSVEVASTHMGFAVSKKGTRLAVAEIVRFLDECESQR